MAEKALKSEFVCTLTGFVAPPREIGVTPRGTRRFFAVSEEILKGLVSGERCSLTVETGC